MNTKIMSIFTRTPLHVGAGSSVGAIDSPIARERHTRIPVIPGSALKGVTSDLWEREQGIDKNGNPAQVRTAEAVELFGARDAKDAKPGALFIGEARVLAFPVRSAKNAFAWVTCPLALQRFLRDTGKQIEGIPDVSGMNCYASEKLQIDKKIILEEYCFEGQPVNGKFAEELKKLSCDETWNGISDRLAIISDEMFSFFVENACEVVTRIRINDSTGTVDNGALFNQEQVPSETMLYTMVGTFKDEALLDKFVKKLSERGNLIQVGGDETTGLGFCSVNFTEKGGN
jgi:CRISPR-associated protein Cmr4